ncbi:MAG TPA: alpha/beta fold hydrolase [Jatrophihabitantaceae bacterium]
MFATCDDGTELAWTSDGAGDPVLLIQGQATPAAGWRPVAAQLSPGYRVIRFEQRGIGASGTGAADRFTTRGFAQDALAVLDAAGAERVHIIGHSMGGKIAQWIAIDAPRRVASLILLATSGGPDRDPAVARAKRVLLRGTAEEREALFFSREWAAAHRSDVDVFFTLRADPDTLTRIYAASNGHDALDHLGAISAPTLVIGGKQDRLVSLAAVRRLADGLPEADLRVIEHARHGLHLEDEEVHRLQRDFLGRQTAR